MLKVRLYRPFDAKAFAKPLPETVRGIAVLDRTKEPGSGRRTALSRLRERALRRGPQRRSGRGRTLRFVVEGIHPGDDQSGLRQSRRNLRRKIISRSASTTISSNTSLDFDPDFSIEPDDVFRALFFGLGADGTVGANKESIKIIGENTANFAQGYFVYDSKKAGAMTISHLRFGPRPIRSTYLIT